MAFLAADFGMSVTYLDGGSNTTTREYMMDPDVATYDDAVIAAAAMIVDIEALTDAEISSYRVFQNLNEGTLVIPAATVQIENCLSLTVLLTAAGNKKANINVPAPKIGAFIASTGPQANVANTTAAIITSFTDYFLVAGTFTISDGEEITRVLDGKRVHKKSNKG
jgi:hypothetical protein